MIDLQMLESLNTKDKEIFKQGLEDLINQTYVLEDEYKKLNESYINLQSFLEQIVESLPNAIWVLQENGEVFLKNSEALKIPGILNLIELDKTSYERELNGSYYLIKINKILGKTTISATDISEEKRRERLASMGQVAAHLSHEIRNPIGSVSLLASTLFKKVDSKSKPLVLEIKKSIWRVEKIIKATLLFTKGVSPNRENFKLSLLESEILEALHYYSYSKGIEVEFYLPDIEIYGDFELLCLVFQNFLFNAIDAIEDEDNLDRGLISFSYINDTISDKIYIKDNAKMIEDETVLFEPFKSTKLKGHGLGLALSLQIVDAHNGSIALLKDEKGFLISLKKAK